MGKKRQALDERIASLEAWRDEERALHESMERQFTSLVTTINPETAAGLRDIAYQAGMSISEIVRSESTLPEYEPATARLESQRVIEPKEDVDEAIERAIEYASESTETPSFRNDDLVHLIVQANWYVDEMRRVSTLRGDHLVHALRPFRDLLEDARQEPANEDVPIDPDDRRRLAYEFEKCVTSYQFHNKSIHEIVEKLADIALGARVQSLDVPRGWRVSNITRLHGMYHTTIEKMSDRPDDATVYAHGSDETWQRALAGAIEIARR